MKEAIQVYALLLLTILIALTPWLLLRQNTTPDATIHHQSVTLLSTELPEAAQDEQPPAPSDEAAEEAAAPPETDEQLALIYRALFEGGYFTVPYPGESEQISILLVDQMRSQLAELQATGALIPLDFGELLSVQGGYLTSFYDPYDARQSVQVLTLRLLYEHYTVCAVMDLQTQVLYGLLIESSEPEAFFFSDPKAYFSYLLPGEDNVSYTSVYDFSGSVSNGEYIISFTCDEFSLMYTQEFVDAVGMMLF